MLIYFNWNQLLCGLRGLTHESMVQHIESYGRVSVNPLKYRLNGVVTVSEYWVTLKQFPS